LAAALSGWAGLWLASSNRFAAVTLAVLASTLLFLAWRWTRAVVLAHAASLRHALDAAATRHREIDILRQMAATLLESEQVESLFREVAKAAAELLQADAGAIMLVVEEGRFLKVTAATGPLAQATGKLVPTDGSLAGWVMNQNLPATSDDLANDARSRGGDDLGLALPMAALAPLRSAGVVIGILAVYNHSGPRGFGPHELQLLQALGDQAVVGLDRAEVFSQSRRNEQALAAKNRELQRATELKSQFLTNMSHELRTPLNAINGFSELLLTEELGALNETQRDFLDSVLRNGRHLLGLINSILDLSKIEAGRMTLTLAETDVREAILGAVVDTASLRTGKAQECKVELDAAPLRAVADATRVRQILYNLLSNASKFTPEGGQVTITALVTRAPLPIPSERKADGPRLASRDAIWVSVRDTGIGVRSEDMSKLFSEFSQVDSSTSRAAQGTGLGLVLSKKFVEMHGGAIGAESVFGRGTSIWFILPVEGPIRRPSTAAEVAPA
jgi:signal transduction histidine kinase